MARSVDDKKTRRALRRLARAKRAAEDADSPDSKLSEWEGEFLDSVGERLEEFGSAFNDPDKGSPDEALSARQAVKLREIEKKAKGKGRKPMSRGNGFKRKTPQRASRSRDIHDDVPETPENTPEHTPDTEPPQRPSGFVPTVIEGGKSGE